MTLPQLRFDHYNINVADRDRAVDFYNKAFGMTVLKETKAADGSFTITFIGWPDQPFRLEITCMRDHPQQYDLGENETHLGLRLAPDESFDRMHEIHRQMGIICYENPSMGIYFVEDPDGYWIEIIPAR